MRIEIAEAMNTPVRIIFAILFVGVFVLPVWLARGATAMHLTIYVVTAALLALGFTWLALGGGSQLEDPWERRLLRFACAGALIAMATLGSAEGVLINAYPSAVVFRAIVALLGFGAGAPSGSRCVSRCTC